MKQVVTYPQAKRQRDRRANLFAAASLGRAVVDDLTAESIARCSQPEPHEAMMQRTIGSHLGEINHAAIPQPIEITQHKLR